MWLLASGRDSDVYAYDEGLVLRRYRDGRSAQAEAATIRALFASGYPVPAVHRVSGPDIVMERVDGPTMAQAMLRGLAPQEAGETLAVLHDRLHALDWPGAGPGEALLHLDLHPLNVLMGATGPVVIDWSNARPGPAGLDVAMTALILAQVVVTDRMLAAAGLPDGLRADLVDALRAFSRTVGLRYADRVPTAEALRRTDRSLSAEELDRLPAAVELALSMA